MEELIENWEKRMNAYRLEADTVKSHIQSIKAMHNFMMLRDCIRELKQQLTLGGVGCSVCGGKEVKTTKMYKPAKKCTKCGKIRLV